MQRPEAVPAGAVPAVVACRAVLTSRARHVPGLAEPAGPFSVRGVVLGGFGGAILGDRIRMQDHFEDPDVFIRSVATRGTLGGLSRSAADIVRVLDAWGADVVLVETVGVGQDELEITKTAHTTLVVMAPGMGDDVQAIKAGILECADVFAVNKADRDGADRMVTSIESNLALQAFGEGQWRPPIVRTEATTGKGVAELLATVRAFRAQPPRQAQPPIVGNLEIGPVRGDALQPDHGFARPQPKRQDDPGFHRVDQPGQRLLQRAHVDGKRTSGDRQSADHLSIQRLGDCGRRVLATTAIALETRQKDHPSPDRRGHARNLAVMTINYR